MRLYVWKNFEFWTLRCNKPDSHLFINHALLEYCIKYLIMNKIRLSRKACKTLLILTVNGLKKNPFYIQSIKYIPQTKYGTYPTSLPPELRTDTVCTNLVPRSGGKEHPDVGHASVLQFSNPRVTGTQSGHTNTGSFAKMVHNLPLIQILYRLWSDCMLLWAFIPF